MELIADEKPAYISKHDKEITFILDSNGKIAHVGDGWYVYSGDETAMPEFHRDDARIIVDIARTITEGNSLSKEVRLLHRETGQYVPHTMKLIPVRKGQQVIQWVGTFTAIDNAPGPAPDTHNPKLVDERLKELEERNKELEQFASIASHDLKEPLRKIAMFSTMVRESLNGEATPQITKYLEKISSATQRMTGLVDELLNYALLPVATNYERTNLTTTAKEAVADLEHAITEKNGIINLEPLPTIDAIPGQMRQVFQNLLSNSLKFSQPGVPPEISITGSYTENDPSDMCHITVSDNGTGFEEQYANRIFEMFERLHDKNTYEGTGIGLAIVKKIIEKHGGTITAQSKPGEGATFIIDLPAYHTGEKK